MYLALNELIETIKKNVNRLQQGEMDIEEMESHLALIRELYERTVILKYKALEAIVPGRVEATAPVEEDITPVQEPVTYVETPKQTPVQEMVVEEKQEEAEIEFDLFGSAFAVEETRTVKEEVPQMPIVEETYEQENTYQQEEEIIAPIEEEYFVEEPTVFEDVQPVVRESYQEQVVSAFNTKLLEVNTELSKQFGVTPLETLIGSFGLNERLLYINELFGGSSDSFSDAIKALDNKSDLHAVSPLIMDYANNHLWDIDSSTVTEFMQKLCRRYA